MIFFYFLLKSLIFFVVIIVFIAWRWPKWVWLKALPPNIAAFLWKLLRQTAPKVKSKGINIILALRCRCFKFYQEEFIVHLLLSIQRSVKMLWYFSSIVIWVFVYKQSLTTWISHVSMDTQFEICRASSAAAYILHEIRVLRCWATYDGMEMRARDICLKVISRVLGV